MYAEVVLSRAARATDKTYHYSIPPDLAGQIKLGAVVLVPFGRRQDVGYVVGFSETTTFPAIKSIAKVVSPADEQSERELKLARWLSDYYLAPLGKALALIMRAE